MKAKSEYDSQKRPPFGVLARIGTRTRDEWDTRGGAAMEIFRTAIPKSSYTPLSHPRRISSEVGSRTRISTTRPDHNESHSLDEIWDRANKEKDKNHQPESKTERI